MRPSWKPYGLALVPVLICLLLLPTEAAASRLQRIAAEPVTDTLQTNERCPAQWGDICLTLDADGTLRALDRSTGEESFPAQTSFPATTNHQGRLAAMDDFLIVAGDGPVLHFFQVRILPHKGRTRSGDLDLQFAGDFYLDATPRTLATLGRTVSVVTTEDELLLIDAGDPVRPVLQGRFPLAFSATALAGDLMQLYALAEDGLRVLDLTQSPPPVTLHRADLRGSGLRLAGRQLSLFDEEGRHQTLVDTDAAPRNIRVNVGNNFFAPADVSIFPGDVVTWRNLSGFHNVLSCSDFGFGCALGPAEEQFTNGPAKGPPWVYSYTFTRPGFNPYKCVPHSPFMVGTVTVENPPPPAIPVTVDIKPGSCLNPVRPGSGGVLPVAIAGTPDFDVTRIVASAVRLAGSAPLRWALEDVSGSGAAPRECGAPCLQEGADGQIDLTLKFDKAAVISNLGMVEAGQCVVLELTGGLADGPGGLTIRGTDTIHLTGRTGKP